MRVFRDVLLLIHKIDTDRYDGRVAPGWEKAMIGRILKYHDEREHVRQI